jgi:hypothetical protein
LDSVSFDPIDHVSNHVLDPIADQVPIQVQTQPQTPPKRIPTPTPDYTQTKKPSLSSRLIVETVRNKQPFQLRLCMDIDSIPEDVNRQFITSHQPFPNPKTHQQYLCNSIAWKLVYLNRDVLEGNLELLQRAVDVYMLQYEDAEYAPRQGKQLMQLVFPEQN